MKYSDELFQLVKSMSKQEKSYFKRFASAFLDKEQSNYLRLFNEIVKQSAGKNYYDESSVKGKNFSGKFIKNLSFHKNYLYNMVLNSLGQYHKGNSEVIIIRNLISQSEILYTKLLYSQSRKVLKKAKELAQSAERYSYVNEILLREKLLNKYTLSINQYSEKNESINLHLHDSIKKLVNNLDYAMLNDWFMEKAYKFGSAFSRTENEMLEIEKFFQNELLKDESKALTFQSRNLLYGLKAHYFLLTKNFEGMYEYNRKLVDLFETHGKLTAGRIENYLIALSNLMNSQSRLGLYEEFDLTAKKMEDISITNSKIVQGNAKSFIFYTLSVLKLAKYSECREFENLEKHIVKVDHNLNLYEKNVTLQQRIILYYYAGLYSFVFGKYEKCIYWLSKIIGLEKSDLSENYQCFARIIHLLSYFELGYFDNLEYTLKSTYRFLNKKKRVYKYENIVLQYLKKSFRIATQKELMEMFREMKYDMEKIRDDPFEQNAFDVFNILYWLESKLNNQSLIEVMKRS